MTIENLRKEARRAILIDGITHSDFFKSCSDKYDLNQEKIAKEISHIPSKELIKKHNVARYLFVLVLDSLVILLIGAFSEINTEQYQIVFWSMFLFLVPAFFGTMAFFSHKRWQYYTCGIIMSLYALSGISDENLIFAGITGFLAILSFYIPASIKMKYKKKYITSTIDDNDTVTTEYLFEN